ncbi:MAG: hypothetical protein N4A72_02785 [Bacteroidales bacterium]|nr:hypothetical protein [Bacteroidales bacterium]
MNKIDRIKPFGTNKEIKLKELRHKYFLQLYPKGNNRIKQAIKIFENAIGNGNLDGFILKTNHIDFLNFLIKYNNIIILGDVKTLNRIISEVQTRGFQSLVYTTETTVFGKKILNSYGYENRFRSHQDRGVWYAKKINVKCCPYCNSQYTLFVQRNNGKGIAKFQFDHFFPKDRYPYLSISMFNLIPSCASCNLTKNSTNVDLNSHYHPYYGSINKISRFKLTYPDSVDKLSFSQLLGMNFEDELGIKFLPNDKSTKKEIDIVNRHNELFDLDLIYERHKDIAHKILVFARMYDKHYQNSMKSIEGLFPDRSTVLKYLIGSLLLEDGISNHPLDKLTNDLVKQLQILE